MKVLIDVTDACKSARNGGIQRITRQLFAELATRVPVTPLCWNRLGNFYHRLDSREMEYLRTPFRRYNGPIGHPYAREDLTHEFLRLLRNGSVNMLNLLRDDDVIFSAGYVYRSPNTEVAGSGATNQSAVCCDLPRSCGPANGPSIGASNEKVSELHQVARSV
jgi:hypothetical protein